MLRTILSGLLVVLGAWAQVTIPAKNEGEVGAGEGPAWNYKEQALYFTHQNKISKWRAGKGVEVFREPSRGTNGLLFDRQGRLIACESQAGRITRTELDGTLTVLADSYEGKKFNSPNDLTMDSKGRIYFSDPRYGRREGMQLEEAVYRIDGPGKVMRVIPHAVVDRPNGVLVSEGDQYLFVADNNNNTPGGPRKLWRFRLGANGDVDLGSKKLMFDWEDGRGPDGIKSDRRGWLYVAGGRTKASGQESAAKFKGGVYVFDQEGKWVEFIPVPVDEVTNCAFGGADFRTLYISAGGTLWSVRRDVAGRVLFGGGAR